MYKELGRFGFINLRSITYIENRIEDARCGYKFGFDLELLPCIKFCNHEDFMRIELRWLNWEISWHKFKLKTIKYGESKD